MLAIPLIVFAAIRAPYELRLFGLLAIGVMISGLAAPLISNTGNAWGIMAVTSAGERYFLLAQIAIVVTFLWAASRLSRQWMKASAWALAGVAFAFGLINAGISFVHELSLDAGSASDHDLAARHATGATDPSWRRLGHRHHGQVSRCWGGCQ